MPFICVPLCLLEGFLGNNFTEASNTFRKSYGNTEVLKLSLDEQIFFSTKISNDLEKITQMSVGSPALQVPSHP